jgi:F420-non-reducing hydrogenase iron-sulfur subunit
LKWVDDQQLRRLDKMSTGAKFTPRILGILCNWCCYGGADLCGVSRFQYPPYIRLIRVMCSARVDLAHILLAFSTGQDALFVGGCHLDDCHYITNGNYDALSVVTIAKKILKHIGVNPNRLRLEWVSAGEGIRFANIMNEFGREVEALGPLGQSEGISRNDLKFRLEAVKKLVPYIKLVQTERLRAPLSLRVSGEQEQNTHQFFNSDEVNRIFKETIFDKLAITQMVSLLREGPLTTREIAKGLGLTPSEVSKHLNTSSRHRLVKYDESQKRYALP